MTLKVLFYRILRYFLMTLGLYSRGADIANVVTKMLPILGATEIAFETLFTE